MLPQDITGDEKYACNIRSGELYKMSRSLDNTNSQSSLKKNAALNMIRTVMSLIFPLITFPYTSRVLGPVYIGKVSFSQSVVSYFSLVAALGISTYAVREVAKVRNDRTRLSKFIMEMLSINLVSTAAAYILLAVAFFLVPQLSEYRKLLCISGASILFTTLGMDYLYTALEEFRYITVRSIAFQILSLVLLFAFVRSKDDYLKYAAVSVVSGAGSNVLNFLHARKFVDFRLLKGTKIELKKHLKPVFTLFAMSAAVSIYTVLDTTMLGFLKGDEAVGIYTAATKINRMVVMMITSATAVLLPRLSYYAGRDESEFFRLSNKAVQFVVMFSVPCAAGLFILAEPVVLLFSGNSYLPAVPVMKIMNAVVVLIALSNVIGIQIFMSAGKEKITLFSVVVGSAVNFTINLVLIPRFGAAGAAVGTVAAEFSVTAVQLAFAGKYLSRRNLVHHSVKVVIAALSMSLCVFGLCVVLKPFTMKIIFGIFFGAVSYALCLFLLKDSLFTELSMQLSGRFYKKIKKEAD